MEIMDAGRPQHFREAPLELFNKIFRLKPTQSMKNSWHSFPNLREGVDKSHACEALRVKHAMRMTNAAAALVWTTTGAEQEMGSMLMCIIKEGMATATASVMTMTHVIVPKARGDKEGEMEGMASLGVNFFYYTREARILELYVCASMHKSECIVRLYYQ